MNGTERFLDTDVLLHLLSSDEAAANRAEAELLAGGIVSVQVLNEFASVATRKLRLALADVKEILATIRSLCSVLPLDEGTHELALTLAERYRLPILDAMTVASALTGGCALLLSRYLQDGQLIDGRLRICNPFG